MGSGLNLIPADLLDQRRARRRVRVTLRLTAGYLALLLAGTLAYLAVHAPSSADAAIGQLAVSRERLGLLRHEVADTQQRMIEIDRRIAGGRIIADRPRWSTLMRLIAQAAGPRVVLGGLTISADQTPDDAAVAVRVTGFAADPGEVSAFVLRLEASGLFETVRMGSSRREPFRQQTATAFDLACRMNAPDMALPPKGGE
jgi:Tfp pilus assembly protein PilN